MYEIIAQILSRGIYFGCYESGTKFIAYNSRGKFLGGFGVRN